MRSFVVWHTVYNLDVGVLSLAPANGDRLAGSAVRVRWEPPNRALFADEWPRLSLTLADRKPLSPRIASSRFTASVVVRQKRERKHHTGRLVDLTLGRFLRRPLIGDAMDTVMTV